MRFAFSVFAVAASLLAVGAQDLSGIPTCALACFAAALPSSGCSATDAVCQCTTGRDAITKSIASCAPSRCSPEDQAKIAPASVQLCAQAGVTITNLSTPAPTASGSSNSASGSAAKATPTPSATSSNAPAQQSKNAAVANGAGMGALALGFAAALL